MGTYALIVHNLATSLSSRNGVTSRPRLVVETASTFRRAQLLDVLQICALVNRYAAEKLMLPRTSEQVALELDNYVVTSDTDGRVLACAAIYEYSPSVAEIASVAVDEAMFGNGLGTQAVLAAERIAAGRGFEEVFAMSLAGSFFESLGYAETPLAAYPEKLARYGMLVASGVEIVPKRCFTKSLVAM